MCLKSVKDLIYVFWRQTHVDDDVHRADEGFPVGVNGHRSDLHHLPGQIVQLVGLDEGGEAFGVKVQLRGVGENVDAPHVTFDLQAVRVPVAWLAVVDLQLKDMETNDNDRCLLDVLIGNYLLICEL